MRYRNRNLRHELKYIINANVYEVLRTRFKAVMKPDTNSHDGEYRVTSLYFDDIYRSSYNDKLNGINSRRKYRIRAYDLSPERITLEAKYKNGSFVSKKNTFLTLEEYYRLFNGDYTIGFDEKFADTSLKEMAVSNSIALYRPSVLVDYFREAYIYEAGNVRLTFDKKLSTSHTTMDMFSSDALFSPVLEYTILEIKYDAFLPSCIEEILSGFPLVQESLSKFMLCHENLRVNNY